MLQPWTGKYFFLHSQHHMLRDTIEKISWEGGRGILVLPVWKNSPHFWSVGKIAVDWWDCPPEMPIYTRANMSWTTCILPFDAMAALDADAGMGKLAGVRKDDFTDSLPSAPPPRYSLSTGCGAENVQIVETAPPAG